MTTAFGEVDVGKVRKGSITLVKPDGTVITVIQDDATNERLATAAVLYDKDGNPVQLTNPLPVVVTEGVQAAAVVVADFHRDPITVGAGSKKDYIALDLDNQSGGGPYKHDETGQGLKIVGLRAGLRKSRITDQWDARFGVVLRIDGANADIAWLQDGYLKLRDTLLHEQRSDMARPNFVLDLTVESNVLVDVAPSFITLNDATINTGVNLDDVAGNSIAPAVGDVLLRVDHISGDGEALLHYQFSYFAE